MKGKFYWNGIYLNYDYENPERFKTVDTDKYDIVEKKEAKIERLEQEVNKLEQEIEEVEKRVKYYQTVVEINLDKLPELSKELEKTKENLAELKG